MEVSKVNIVITGSVAYDYLMNFPGLFKDHILPEHIEKLVYLSWWIVWRNGAGELLPTLLTLWHFW